MLTDKCGLPPDDAADCLMTTPAVLAVRVEVRAPAARTAAPYTSTVPSTAMCLCVRLQNTHEDPAPVRSDAKYTEKAYLVLWYSTK